MENIRVRDLDPYPDLLFVGGSTEWKWDTAPLWCGEFPRVHVGRVNTGRQLDICRKIGAESVDGTGWMRGDPKQIQELGLFLMRQAGYEEPEHVAHIVRHSRLKLMAQYALPLEGQLVSA